MRIFQPFFPGFFTVFQENSHKVLQDFFEKILAISPENSDQEQEKSQMYVLVIYDKEQEKTIRFACSKKKPLQDILDLRARKFDEASYEWRIHNNGWESGSAQGWKYIYQHTGSAIVVD